MSNPSISHRALLSLGDQFKEDFINFITQQAKNVTLTMEFPSIAINVIRMYIKKYPKSAKNALPQLTEAIL